MKDTITAVLTLLQYGVHTNVNHGKTLMLIICTINLHIFVAYIIELLICDQQNQTLLHDYWHVS
jgi:hypothetical protein